MRSENIDIDRFYLLLARLEERCGGKRRLADCDRKMNWPSRGVYFFFEEGEFRSDGATQRVVRVGTHALRQSNATLWNRLSQHRGTVGGAMPGGGNHRGSVFRLHVGTSLLASGHWPDSIRASWALGSSASGDVRRNEYPLELAVSQHIGAMPLLWLEVNDPPGPTSDRGVIERGAIALLSAAKRSAIDLPSSDWIGSNADRDLISESGLWNVNHLRDEAEVNFLEIFEDHLARMAQMSRLL